MSEASRVRFAEFEADLRARELFRDGERIPLQGRPFEVLAALLERPSEVVLRRELSERLWPGQIVEFDNNLNTAVTKLRRALHDTSDDPTVIETLPKRGYRLLVPVERVETPKTGHSPHSTAGRSPATSSPDRSSDPPNVGLRIGITLALLTPLFAILFTAVFLSEGGREAFDPRRASSIEAPRTPGSPHRTALIVVLPFATQGVDTTDERLADALTEELINRLAEILPVEVGVIARTSAMNFKEKAVDIAAVREALNVDYVLEGSVSRHGPTLEISARFIHASDQAHLWADSYDAALDEIPRIQRSMAERIATAVSAELRSSGQLTTETPVTTEAWEAYLQGRYLLTSGQVPSKADISTAVGHLERAVDLAPDFALAWAALADAIDGEPGPAQERHKRAHEAAVRAIKLDPSLAQPHHRLASLALYGAWNWEAADREFDWALSLAPNLAVLHHSRAAWYSTQKRHEEALQSIERALGLDPLSVVLHADAGWYLFVARRYEEAVEACHRAIQIVPEHRGANSYLFHSLIALGRDAEAAEAARTLLEIEEASPEARARATLSPEAAIEELRRHRLAVLDADYRAGMASPGRLALAHLALGRTETALDLLEEGAESRWGWIYPFLSVYPLLDPLAEEPRFKRLLRRVAAPQPQSSP